MPVESPPAPAPSRVVLHDIRWETFEALLEVLGEGRARIAYDRGTLELMSPSQKHEWLKRLIGRLIETFTEELGIDILSCGSTTLKSFLKKRGVEPDECYYVQNEPAVRGAFRSWVRDRFGTGEESLPRPLASPARRRSRS